MKRVTLLIIFAIFALQLSVTAGDRYHYDKAVNQMDAGNVSCIPYNLNQLPTPFLVTPLAGAFSVDSITVGPEIFTQLTGFDDYKTNGEANHFLQVDPANPLNVFAIDVQTDSSDPTGVTTRRTKYAISSDGGATWTFNGDCPDGIRSGFCFLDLRNGAAVIANHGLGAGTVLDANLYVELAPQAGTFQEYQHSTHAPWGIWPQIAVLSNGNVVKLDRRNIGANGPETLYVSIWNGTTMGSRTPFFIHPDSWQATIGSNATFHVATNGSGLVTGIYDPVLGLDTNTGGRVIQRTSTDNGVTWGSPTTVFAPTITATDTIDQAGGSDFIYKKGTNRWFYSMVTAKGGTFASATLILIRSDGTQHTLTDAATVGATATYQTAMSFVFSIDQPALGFSRDGSLLYCTYAVVKPDTSRGFNQRDLYFQYSSNEGNTWCAPIRLTSTTSVDECYASVSSFNKGISGSEPMELNFTYMKDPGVGPTTFGGSAPLSRNQLIYRKITFSGPIGIHDPSVTLDQFSLSQNYPNPFNPSTKISYVIPQQGLVTLKIFDILGREVKTLVNEVQSAGQKEIEFNAENLTTGIYFYTITAGDFKDTKKMILVK